MNSDSAQGTVREAVAAFHTLTDMEQAIDDLQEHGFDRAQISLLATDKAIEAKLGHAFDKVNELEDDPDAPRVAYISRDAVGDAQGAVIGGLVYAGALAGIGAIVASGGALLPLIGAAAAGGAGGLVFGSFAAKYIGDVHAKYLSDQLDKGGLLLWVRTFDDAQEHKAVDILKQHAGDDIHVHGLPATEMKTEECAGGEIGWYDDTAYWYQNTPFHSLEDARAFAKGIHGI